MSTDLHARAFMGEDNPIFQLHLKAVKFCLETGLSFPKETSEFFKGKIDGMDLEENDREYLLDFIESDTEIQMDLPYRRGVGYIEILVSDIPKDAKYIRVSLES